MKGIFLVLMVVLVAFVFNTSPVLKRWASDYLTPLNAVPQKPATALPVSNAPVASFKCDGRIYCSQMTSCAEATYFLGQCPGTKMDGNHDGIPCEIQWCH